MRTPRLRNRKSALIVRLVANVALVVVTVTIAATPATPATPAATVGVSRPPVKAIAQQLKRHQRLTPP